MAEPIEKPKGNADPGSLRVRFGPPEHDLATQRTRWRRFYTWTEDGRSCGSWAWVDDAPRIPNDSEVKHG